MAYRYYQDEINYLRILGQEFAERYPETAGMLGKGARDPDVERLLQGFAFLTGRLHERLDDQYSQIVEAYLNVLWPEMLKPIPSLTMIEFDPDEHALRSEYMVRRGTELSTDLYGWGPVKFRTCRDVMLYPFKLREARFESTETGPILRLRFQLNPTLSSLRGCSVSDLPLYIFSDDPRFSNGWYQWLTCYAKRVMVRTDKGNEACNGSVIPLDLAEKRLLPVDMIELPNHRVLRDYLVYPKHVQFVNLKIGSFLPEMDMEKWFDVVVSFGTEHPKGVMREVSRDSFRLYCTPAANLFESSARLRIDHRCTEYIVRSDNLDIDHHEVFSLEEVTGISPGLSLETVTFRPFYSTQLDTGYDGARYPVYRTRFKEVQLRGAEGPVTGRECYVSFDDALLKDPYCGLETISIKLLCTNRNLASSVQIGDVKTADKLKALVRFRNIDQPTSQRNAPSFPEQLKLVAAALALSRRSLTDPNGLKSIIDFQSGACPPSRVRHLLDGLGEVAVSREVSIVDGAPARTLGIRIHFDCDIDNESEFLVFGHILSEFFSMSASINSRLDFEFVFGTDRRRVIKWSAKCGKTLAI